MNFTCNSFAITTDPNIDVKQPASLIIGSRKDTVYKNQVLAQIIFASFLNNPMILNKSLKMKRFSVLEKPSNLFNILKYPTLYLKVFKIVHYVFVALYVVIPIFEYEFD